MIWISPLYDIRCRFETLFQHEGVKSSLEEHLADIFDPHFCTEMMLASLIFRDSCFESSPFVLSLSWHSHHWFKPSLGTERSYEGLSASAKIWHSQKPRYCVEWYEELACQGRNTVPRLYQCVCAHVWLREGGWHSLWCPMGLRLWTESRHLSIRYAVQ